MNGTQMKLSIIIPAYNEERLITHCLESIDAALAVNPSPALLAFMIQTPLGVDEYLMWSVSEGGALFGSDMPACKDRLSIAEIWKIIADMRWGFRVNGPSGPK